MSNFFERLDGREIFHYSGQPCFIKVYKEKTYVIETESGEELEVYPNQLDSPSEEEMDQYI